MLVIGLTGGISTGKSTVSSFFAEEGIKIIDADQIAKSLVTPYSKAWKKLVSVFGNEIVDTDTHEIDRKKLGTIIFSDSEARRKLNSIIHPMVMKEIIKSLLICYFTLTDIVVLDIPLLFETGFDKFVSKTVVVYCTNEIQVERLKSRDSLDSEAANRRINAQMDIEKKKLKADYIIDNSSQLEQTEMQVHALIERLRPSKLRTLFWLALPFVSLGLGILYAIKK